MLAEIKRKLIDFSNSSINNLQINLEMKKIITIKIEVDMNHPACEEWEKRKDFVDTEIDDVLDHIRDFTRPYKKEVGKSPSKATTYSVTIQDVK